MTTLGQDLKRERELRAVALSEIASATKVSVRAFEALEADRWDLLPGSFFIKGLIRSYCKTIGADENYFLNKYHHENLLHKAAEAPEARPRFGRGKQPSFSGRFLPRPRTVLVGIVLLAALAALLFLILKPRRPTLPVIPKPASFAVPRVTAPAVPADPVPAAKAAAADPAAPLRLELAFKADTWMLVLADGRTVLDGIQKAGEVVRLEAAGDFVLHTGNAGGVEWKINDRPALPLGGAGVVRTDIRVTRDNAAAYLREPDPSPPAAPGR